MDRSEGRKYRHMVLEKGGAQDEMITLREFFWGGSRAWTIFIASLAWDKRQIETETNSRNHKEQVAL
jgi:hypothetical protein